MQEAARIERGAHSPEMRERQPNSEVVWISLVGGEALQQDAYDSEDVETPAGKRLVLAVADGSQARGEKASAYAVKRIVSELAAEERIDAPMIRETFLSLHEAISETLPETETGGISEGVPTSTTLTAVVREGNKLTTAHVGDSEAWIFKHELRRRTVPHTLLEHTKDKARLSRMSSKFLGMEVTRSLGDTSSDPLISHEPDIDTLTLDGSETFVLVGSKGFWEVATRGNKKIHALEHILLTAKSAEEARGKILSLLERQNIKHNVTLLIAKL